MIELKFTGVAPVVQGWKYGIDRKKHQFHDASFTVTFDESKVNPTEVNQMVGKQMNKMRYDFPQFQMINQSQRQV